MTECVGTLKAMKRASETGENDAGGDGLTGIVGETMHRLNTATHAHAAPCPIERTLMRHSALRQATGVVSYGCKSVACFQKFLSFGLCWKVRKAHYRVAGICGSYGFR